MLYTLLSDSCDNAPNSCRLALRRCDGVFHPGQRVWFYPHGIEIGADKWIDFSTCQLWQPCRLFLTAADIHRISWRAWSQKIERQINNSSSLFYYRGANLFYREMARQLQHYRQELLNALRRGGDPQPAILNLLGAGTGLTPSGDDWLVGFIAIYLLPGHPGEKYRQTFLTALEEGKEKTTLLSAITLDAAIQQRYRQRIMCFIQAIISNQDFLITAAMKEMKKIGASSGCDMLCGIADACALTPYCGED